MNLVKKFSKMLEKTAIEKPEDYYVMSPMRGEIVALSKLKDPAFSSGVLGKGIAIDPRDGKVFAPFDGTIETIFPTMHAVGLVSESGVELLIHVGMDTVNLNGQGFQAKVKQGDKIKQGDLILEFDINAIKAAGFSTVSPVVVTNSDVYGEITPKKDCECIEAGEELIVVK